MSRTPKRAAVEYVYALRKRKAAIIKEFKESRGCQRCGEMHPATLDLHHVNPEDKHPRLKRKNASGSRRTGGYFWRDLSYADLEAELNKCQVLCSNCHRKQMATDMGWHSGGTVQLCLLPTT